MRTTFLLMLLAGCSDATSSSGDLAGADLMPPRDFAMIPLKGLTVLVKKNGAPAANARVLFHDASGAVTADQMTGADGKITAGSAPRQVTVYAVGNGRDLVTYTDVEEGDELVLDDGAPAPTTVGTWNVSVGNQNPGASYRVLSPCSASDAMFANFPLAMTMRSNCTQAQNSILVLAQMANGQTLQSKFDSTLAAPPQGGSLDVSLSGSWADVQDIVVKLANANAAATNSSSLSLMMAEQRFALLPNPGSASPAAAAGAGYRGPLAFPDEILLSASWNRDAASGGPSSANMERFNPDLKAGFSRTASSYTHTIDAAEGLDPIDSITVDVSAPGRPVMTILQPPGRGEGGVAQLAFNYKSGGMTIGPRTWLFVISSMRSVITAPVVPPVMSGYVLEAMQAGATASFRQSTLLPTHQLFKKAAMDVALPGAIFTDGSLTAAGRVWVTTR